MKYEIMPFGKHQGSKIKELPLSYVEWLLSSIDRCREIYPGFRESLLEAYAHLSFKKLNEEEEEKEHTKSLFNILQESQNLSKRKIYLFESSPIDDWTGWIPLMKFHTIRMQEYLNRGCNAFNIETALIENLLVSGGSLLFSRTDNNWRGEPIYCFVNYQPISNECIIAICIKADNNGDCYAISDSLVAAKLMPNCDQEWECIEIEEVC